MSQPSLAVLISGTGRNLQAILDAVDSGHIDARMAVVISNRPDAAGLQRANAAGVKTEVVDQSAYPDRETYDQALAQCIDQYQPDLIALAGFMRILSEGFVRRYMGRMFNIHPSLLPKYRGLHTHRRALAAGDTEHGASVHFVTPELDSGPVVLQGSIEIGPNDDEVSLAQRIMQEVELQIYPQVLAWAAAGRLQLRDNSVYLDGQRLDATGAGPNGETA